MDPNESLIEIDSYLAALLREKDEGGLQKYIIDLLTSASRRPGRSAKLHVTYLMERMAELVKDLIEDSNVAANEDGFLRWIDRGLIYATYLTDPDSQGRWIKSFDQTLIKAKVLNPKDPEAAKLRQKEAAELSRKWQEAIMVVPKDVQAQEPRRSSGNRIILPR
jgi:hypothetical protein